MSLLTAVAVGVYFAGDGVRGLPNGGLIGSIAMIFAGLLLIVGALV